MNSASHHLPPLGCGGRRLDFDAETEGGGGEGGAESIGTTSCCVLTATREHLRDGEVVVGKLRPLVFVSDLAGSPACIARAVGSTRPTARAEV